MNIEPQQIALALVAFVESLPYIWLARRSSAAARQARDYAQRDADLRETLAARGEEIRLADDRLKAETVDERGRVRGRVYYDATIGK